MRIWKVDSFDLDKTIKEAECGPGEQATVEDVLTNILNMYEGLGAKIRSVFYADNKYTVVYYIDDVSDETPRMKLHSMFDGNETKNNIIS